MHSVANTGVSVRTSGHQDRVHFAIGTALAVAAQVARVGCSLVKVGLLGLCLALEFEDHDGPVHEKHYIGPARFERQSVLKNRWVLFGELIDLDDLADLDSDSWNPVIPGPDLRLAGVCEGLLERDSDDARFGVRESREVALHPQRARAESNPAPRAK